MAGVYDFADRYYFNQKQVSEKATRMVCGFGSAQRMPISTPRTARRIPTR